tara:strand:+ start:59250 stop:59480 length:231 start_codon:yes stop_codon:yes gene_type:complete
MKEQISCKHVRREGESCRLNNSCRYPNCPAPELGAFFVPTNRGEPFTNQQMKDAIEWLGSDEATESLEKLTKKLKQ